MRANTLIGILMSLFLIGSAVSSSLYDLIVDGVTCTCKRSTDLDVSKVKIYWYNYETNLNDSYYIDEAAKSIQGRQDFDPEQCMHLFIPGFDNNINSTTSDVMRCALKNYTCNSKKIILVIIDHSHYLSGNFIQKLNIVKLYQNAVKYTKSISISIAKFMVSMLKELGTGKVMASGHSLGGQMVGEMANYTKNEGYPLKKILAIDPAGPCYENCPSEHVRSGQADEVMAIHCNAGELGSKLNLTDYDAYSGNGLTQMDCKGGNAIDLIIKGEASSCSHSKCVPITMQTALQSNIWNATECGSYAAYSSGSCSGNNTMLVGYNKTGDGVEGIYYFEPNNNLTCTS